MYQYNQSRNPDDMYRILLEHVYAILSVMCPIRRYKQRIPKVSWINNDIFRAIRTRKFYVSLFKTTRLNNYLLLSHVWRNKVNTMINNAKSVYIKSQLERNANNPKKFWRVINSFLDNETVEHGNITFKDMNSGENVEKGNEPTFLNNYFVNIAERLGLNSDTVYNVDNFPHYDLLDELQLEHTDVGIIEIERLAKNIDISKASCIENINSRICRDILLIMPNKFCQLFNTSLNRGIFPRLWAKGYVNVIPKGGDLNSPGNWRPITQTNIFAKTLEKIIHKRLLDHVLVNDILSKYQFGFLPGRSTQLAVFDLLRHIYSSLNNKKFFGSACLDISKAFDCINHTLLLSKLRNISLSKMSLTWFKSYLDRSQELTFNDGISECI